MLMDANVTYDPATKPDTMLAAMDTAIDPLRSNPVDKATLNRAKVKLRSSLYDTMGQLGGFGLMDMLASFALFDDDPGKINTLVTKFEAVTPEQIQKTAQEYLRPSNRTVIDLEPAPKGAAKPTTGQ
jgi:predicted Zn-dependent peptidase